MLYELRRARERIHLGPQVFNVLAYLVQHRQRVIPKQELFERLWPGQFVDEDTLERCIRAARRALGDTRQAPHLIQTLRGRGYRFMAVMEVRQHDTPTIGRLPTVHLSAPPTSSPSLRVHSPLLPGRETEFDTLHRGLATTLTGARQLLFVTGEAGLGKTTLIDVFLATVERRGPLWIGHGQCLDHYGAGEAYLPILGAMEQLCRGPGGPDIVESLRQQAPTWLVQMPGLVSPAELEGLQRRVLGTTQERMLREMAEALNVLTAA